MFKAIVISEILAIVILGILWFAVSPRTAKDIGVFLFAIFTGLVIYASKKERLPKPWQGFQGLVLIAVAIYCFYAFGRRRNPKNSMYRHSVVAIIVTVLLLASSVVSAITPFFDHAMKTAEEDPSQWIQLYLEFDLPQLQHNNRTQNFRDTDTLADVLKWVNIQENIMFLDTVSAKLEINEVGIIEDTNEYGDWTLSRIYETYGQEFKKHILNDVEKPKIRTMNFDFIHTDENAKKILVCEATERDRYLIKIERPAKEFTVKAAGGNQNTLLLSRVLKDFDKPNWNVRVEVATKPANDDTKTMWKPIDDWKTETLPSLVNYYGPMKLNAVVSNDGTYWVHTVKLRILKNTEVSESSFVL